MRLRFVALITAFSAAALGCSGGGGDGGPTSPAPNNPTPNNPNPNNPAPTGSTSIQVSNNTYTPGTKTVNAGSTVTWQWAACTGGGYGGGYDDCPMHTVTFDDGPTSDPQNSGSFSRTFVAKGTYKYHCQTHGQAMSGTITVQ